MKNRRDNTLTIGSPGRQGGAALAVSLILLVGMTILGIATLNSTRLTEKIASNAQQKAATFETAESAINAVYDVPTIKASIKDIPASQLNDPDPVDQNAVATALTNELDQTGKYGVSVDIDATSSIQFCGEGAPVGTDLNVDESQLKQVGLLFDVRGGASIANSNARSDHVQRARVNGIGVGRTGKCVAPG